MSAAPQFPPGYGPEARVPEQPPAPPRRPRWQRILLWIAVAGLAFIILAFVSVYALLHSRSFHNYALRTAQQKASAALNANVHIREFTVNFSGISPILDLYGVVVDGAPPHTNPPLLQVPHIRVGVQITSILTGQWYLNEITVDQPVVQVFVDANGKDNLPQTGSSGASTSNTSNASSSTSIFDLAIRHALLDRGVVLYNNHKSVMQADLHDLNLRAHFNTGNHSYSGTLAYDNGHLKMANYDTIPHSFHADFVAGPNKFVLQKAVLQSGPSQFVLNATLTDYSHPKLTGSYQAILSGGQFRNILRNPTIPTGTINLAGNLSYVAQPNVPALQNVDLTGTLKSNELVVRTAQFSGPIRNLSANYTVQNDNLVVPDLSAQILGGQLNGSLHVQDISGAQKSKLDAKLNNVAIGKLKSVVKGAALNKLGVRGKADLLLTATWGKSFSNLDVNVDANLNSTVTPTAYKAPSPAVARRGNLKRAGYLLPMRAQASNAPASQSQNQSQNLSGSNSNPQGKPSVPVKGHIHLHYSGKSKQLTLSNSYLKTPNTTVNLNGSLTGRQGMSVNLNHVDLHQLVSLANLFSSAEKPSLPPSLSGIASFHGKLHGALTSPRLTGLVQITSLSYNGASWQLLRTNVDVSPSKVALQNGLLKSKGPGQARFKGSVGLHHFSFNDSSQFSAVLNGNHMNLANLTRAAGLTTPVTGSLSASVNAHGTKTSPAGTVDLRVANAKVSGQPVRLMQVKANSDGNAIQGNLSVTIPAGTATAKGTYYLDRQNYQVALRAVGIQLAQLAAINPKNLGLSGTLNLTASGQGNINNPRFSASLAIPKLQVRDQTISNLDLNADVANHVAKLVFGSQAVNTSLWGRATVNLTGNYETTASVDTQSIPLAPLVAVYLPSQAGNLTGQTELHGTIAGPLKQLKNVQAHFTIPTLAVNYLNKVQIAAPQPIQVDYVNGVLDIQRSALKGTDTDLNFQGRIPVLNKNANVSLLLLGTVDLKLIQVISPTVTTSGQVRFDINSFGQLQNPNVEGQIRIINAALSTGAAPLGLENGNGVLTLTRDRLEITRFDGKVGGGTVQARGAVLYRPSLSFDMALQGRGVRMLYPDGVRSGFGMNLTLTGTPEAATLGGQVNVHDVSFTPAFDMTSLLGQFSGSTQPPPSQGFTKNLRFDIKLRTLQGLNLVSRELSVDGSMNLNLRGTAAQPVLLGRINLTGGDFIFNGERFVLQSGTIDFVNPSMTQPSLNLALGATIKQYNVALRLEGPVDHMRTIYSSDPALPPADIIHLIAFGSTTESASANPALPGKLAAEQKVASAVSSQLTSRVAKIAGLSQLSIDPTLGGPGAQANPGAIVTIQHRVTSKIFVTFSTDVTSTQNEVIQVKYRSSPKFSFSGTRDQNGGFAFDTKIHKSWK